jgi:23S rRNA (guanosine2251-2'-O)-methyltransferase
VHTARPNKHTRPNSDIILREEEELPALIEGSPAPLLLVLDCVQDPQNLGACLRSADAAGVTCLVIPKDKSAPISDTVVRVSCGGAENVPIVRVTNLARAMEKMKKLGVWFVGTTDEATKSLYDVDLKGPIAIVMGAEGAGMRRLTQENCDFLVSIPMAGQVPCLNVSVATGVCLFEAVRQRMPPKQPPVRKVG